MPEEETLRRAEEDKAEGKAPSTQAGEFVREEIHHIREGKHGARSTKQAIAIGLSKARRAGVDLPPPPGSSRSKSGSKSRSRKAKGPPARTRARASLKVLKHEGREAASSRALSRQARSVARQKSGSSAGGRRINRSAKRRRG